MMKLSDLSALAEIEEVFNAVTDLDLKRTGYRLRPKLDSEQDLGTIHSEEAHRMWAVATIFERRALDAAVRGKFEAETEEEMKECFHLSKRYQAFEAFARELFWITAKTDIGGRAWSAGEVSLRSGWMLVVSQKQKTAASFLSGLLPPGFTPGYSDDEED